MEKKKRPQVEVADIFRLLGQNLESFSYAQKKVAGDIVNCRTPAMGGHKEVCDEGCGHEEISYNSCRNRHCPKCQFARSVQWLEARLEELLPVEYFHVVFTIPHILNPIALQNKKEFYNILFKASSETLKEVAARNLKAEAGFISILHTWGQNLMDHPHIHTVIPGGGLSFDGEKWISCKKGYLFPVKILSKVFRGKFLNYLEDAFNKEKLEFHGRIVEFNNESTFKGLLKDSTKKQWVVYSKKPFAGPQQVFEYISNYTHRVAISNHRLIKIEDDLVYFRYRDYADNDKDKVMKLHNQEFTRRFLLHVLPKNYVRIRHFGFMGNRFRKEKNEKARKLINNNAFLEKQKERCLAIINKRNAEVKTCPQCKKGTMLVIEELKPALTHYSIKRIDIYDTS